jgi:hypothetical protein
LNSEQIPKHVEQKIKGRTLEVYLYILKKHDKVGVREVQRALKFSSSSLAVYHIDKLIELGIIDRDQYGRYFLVERPTVNEMKPFMHIGRIMVPRLLFYAVIFSTLSAFYLLLGSSLSYTLAVITVMTAAGIFWYEAFTIWKAAPLAFEFHNKFMPLVSIRKLGLGPFVVIGVLAISVFLVGIQYIDIFNSTADLYYIDGVATFDEQMAREQSAHAAMGIAPYGMSSLAPSLSLSWIMFLPLVGIFAVTIAFLRFL